jgi:membrane protein YdbS with pleckstrin-like domain
MYCKKCGTPNDTDAVYCKKCGTMLEAEDETRVVRRDAYVPPSTVDAAPLHINPTLKFIKAGYGLAALGAIVLVAILALTPIPIWISVIIGLLLFLMPAYYHLQQRMVSYSLTDQCIEVDTGVISRTTRNIPLTRIQDVTVTSGALQRLLNFGDVVVDNASEDGGKLIIRNIDSPREYADKLLSRMRRLEIK